MKDKEENKDTQEDSIFHYNFEEVDNGCTLEYDDENYYTKCVALRGDNKGADKCSNYKSLIGSWIWEDLNDYMNRHLVSKVKITIKFEDNE